MELNLFELILFESDPKLKIAFYCKLNFKQDGLNRI